MNRKTGKRTRWMDVRRRTAAGTARQCRKGGWDNARVRRLIVSLLAHSPASADRAYEDWIASQRGQRVSRG